MEKTTGPYPASTVDGAGSNVVPHAGSTVLLRTVQAVGLTSALSAALAPWRKPLARHDPGKIVADLAVSLAIGGGCLAILAQLRAAPEVFGPVASDPTVSRCRLSYSVGFSLPGDLASIQAKLATIPAELWEPAYDADGQLRPGAWVAAVTGLFDLRSWPAGMRRDCCDFS